MVHVADEDLGRAEDGPPAAARPDQVAQAEDDTRRIVAETVELADTALSQARGLRFRSDLPADFAYVMEVGGEGGWFPFSGGPFRNLVDMLFMRVPIDIVWLLDDEVVATKRMQPWRSFAMVRADTIVELPAGAADDVSTGDRMYLEANGETAAGSGDETE